MGILGCFALGEIVGSPNPPFPSVRMARLFYEFLSRYKEWKVAKHQEMVWRIVAWCLGLFNLVMSLFVPGIWTFMSVALFTLFYFVMRYYLELNKRVNHLQVNVQILHHHLMGKLEVGFCDHAKPCRCTEKFYNYVMRNFGISLDKNFLK